MQTTRPFKELVVISGKGGTGKTSIVGSFAAINSMDKILADCDVDAADLHLILEPRIRDSKPFSGGKIARVITEKCIGCGKCEELCRYGAVVPDDTKFKTDPIVCEGCGVCAHFCPEGAIEFSDEINGEWFVSDTRHGTMVHAKLGIAQENSGKLVSIIRMQAKQIAQKQGCEMIIVDGPPGIGCPVIASITGADMVLVVTEPTPSGLHDLERAAVLADGFNIPVAICINKFDINLDMTNKIASRAKEKGWQVLGRVRYDPAVTKAQIAGLSILEHGRNKVSNDIRSLWDNVINMLEKGAEYENCHSAC